MSKPILIIKFPISFPPKVADEIITNINNKEDLISEYHVFTLPNSEDSFDFKVFNGEYTNTEYQRLTDVIEELKKSTNPIEVEDPYFHLRDGNYIGGLTMP